MIKIKNVFSLSEVGKRKNQQDAIYPINGTVSDNVFVVCDGVGGNPKGEIASKIASETIGSFMKWPYRMINEAADLSMKRMKEHSIKYKEGQFMSTTMTFAKVNETTVDIAWCGDSRIMHIRDGKIIYKTFDHSYVYQLVKEGIISESEAEFHPEKNIITRCLNGEMDDSKIETHTIQNIQEGDYLILCTDGVLENLNKEAIRNIFTSNLDFKTIPSIFDNLCKNKTSDNYSMYLIKF